MTAMAYGVHYSFGVFFKPLQVEFVWSSTATSGIFSFYQISHCGLGFFSGWAAGKYGTRAVVLSGGIALGVGLMLAGQVTSLWQMYICYGLLVALGMSVAFSPLLSMVSRWFVQRKGLALGLVTTGVELGTVIVSPLSRKLISNYGWSRAYFILGVGALLVVTVAALFLRKEPQKREIAAAGEVQEDGDGEDITISQSVGLALKQAMRTRSLWLLMAMFALAPFGLTMVMTHVVNYAQLEGIEPIKASVILSIIGGASIAGRI
ncbi:MAG: MFS transporter [Dehalococcoidia bacterium]|nr:MFS transporter [Dehalococcoidia bacterium]